MAIPIVDSLETEAAFSARIASHRNLLSTRFNRDLPITESHCRMFSHFILTAASWLEERAEIPADLVRHAYRTQASTLMTALFNEIKKDTPASEVVVPSDSSPHGDPFVYEVWMNDAEERFRERAKGPQALIDQMTSSLVMDFTSQLNLYRRQADDYRKNQERIEKMNREQEKYRAEQRAKLDATKSDLGKRAKELEKQLKEAQKKLDEDLRNERQAHAAALDQANARHAQAMRDEQARLHREQAERLQRQQTELDKQIQELEEKVKKKDKELTDLRSQISGKGCFSGAVLVELEGGRHTAMFNLRVGDRIHVGGGVFEEVLGFYDRNGECLAQFYEIAFVSDRGEHGCLTVTGNHLLLAATQESASPVFVQAAKLQVGSKLIGSSREFVEVTEIRETVGVGVYSPATSSGRLVVSDPCGPKSTSPGIGMIASCYAKPSAFSEFACQDDSVHRTIHTVTLSVRIWWHAYARLFGSSALDQKLASHAEASWAASALKTVFAGLFKMCGLLPRA